MNEKNCPYCKKIVETGEVIGDRCGIFWQKGSTTKIKRIFNPIPYAEYLGKHIAAFRCNTCQIIFSERKPTSVITDYFEDHNFYMYYCSRPTMHST